ncbi:hypothetical protein N665_0383s0182 [Sinapis alba]|nr:hypothetical protein N665_0383s0182 [Sinapis alba]
MPPKRKKKTRSLLNGSSKMARFQGASKAAASIGKLSKSSPLASASGADAVTAAPVVEMSNTLPIDQSVSKITVDLQLSPLPAEEDTTLILNEHNSTSEDTGEPTPLVIEKDAPSFHEKDGQIGTHSESASAEEDQPQEASPLGERPGVNSYAGLLKQSAILEVLGTPSEHVSGAPFVLIPDENIAAAKEEFRDFIYARFHGIVNAIWAKSGPRIFVHNVGQGEYLLKVTNAKTKELLLARSCWNVAGFPMFVAPWSPDFTPEEAPLTNVVVPVELRDVPYLLFNKESLSRLATAVGKPVSLAPETERKDNFQVAKIFVRVDLTRNLPSKIITGFSNGREVEISVSYPWLPLKCEACTRKRSVSPPVDVSKTGPRNQSRSGQGKDIRRTVHSVGAPGQVDADIKNSSPAPALEESEIPPSAAQADPGTSSGNFIVCAPTTPTVLTIS